MKHPIDVKTSELLTDAGYNLRLIRQAKGLRIEDLANASGLSARSIKNIEAGKDFMFSSLVSLVRALKKDPQDVWSLVPAINAPTLQEELTYAQLAMQPNRRVRTPRKGMTP
jgi:transcriptional regulator with XRE-family HTH domain